MALLLVVETRIKCIMREGRRLPGWHGATNVGTCSQPWRRKGTTPVWSTLELAWKSQSLALILNLVAPSASARFASMQHGGGHQGPNTCKDMSMENARNQFVTRWTHCLFLVIVLPIFSLCSQGYALKWIYAQSLQSRSITIFATLYSGALGDLNLCFHTELCYQIDTLQ